MKTIKLSFVLLIIALVASTLRRPTRFYQVWRFAEQIVARQPTTTAMRRPAQWRPSGRACGGMGASTAYSCT